MQKTEPVKSLVWLLVLSLFLQGASAVAQVAQPQPVQRERRVAAPVAPSADATAPAAASEPARSRAQGVAPHTLAELQGRINEVLARPQLSSALIAVKVASLETGHILFEQNAGKLLRPASNMKLYTVAAALDRLSPDYRFETTAYSSAPPDTAGSLRGDLVIYGRGDPSMAARFYNGDYNKGIDELAERIQAAGVKRVEGDLVGDETYFIGPPQGAGWEWEDLTWYYGAEVSALTVNDNALDLFVKPGASVGSPCVITTGPASSVIRIVNGTTTAPRGTRRDLRVYRALGSNVLEVSGQVALDDTGYTGGIGLTHPASFFMEMLRQALERRGVVITGRTRTIDARANGPIPAPAAPRVTIASRQSPPLSLIAARTLKPSQNLYTELLLRTLGKTGENAPTGIALNNSATGTPTPPATTEGAGLLVVKKFLTEAGVNPNQLVLSDGSGLSRNDMITAEATTQLLIYMSRHRYAAAWREALPIGGVDGTLRNSFKGTPAENNVRAKTGTLSSVNSLSGYVTSAAGERLVFSIMVNNFQQGTDPRRECIDPITILLATFAGRS